MTSTSATSSTSSTTCSSRHLYKISVLLLVIANLLIGSGFGPTKSDFTTIMNWIKRTDEKGGNANVSSFGNRTTSTTSVDLVVSKSSSSWADLLYQTLSSAFYNKWGDSNNNNDRIEGGVEKEQWVASFGVNCYNNYSQQQQQQQQSADENNSKSKDKSSPTATNAINHVNNDGKESKKDAPSFLQSNNHNNILHTTKLNPTTYPLHLSTEECHTIPFPPPTHYHHSSYHYNPTIRHYGKFASIRSTLDYTYHGNYTKMRQLLQDDIVEMFLNQTTVVDVENGEVCQAPTENWIVFTAGAMGAGKSYTIKHLHSQKRFPLQSFVAVDPDEIRRHLPEFHIYAKHTPQNAGEKTRKEAGYISEILTLAALQSGKNVLVDGSLRDSTWYREYFEQLRREYEDLKIAILHIMAPREAVFERAEVRSKMTGRVVPRQTLELALEQVPKSVRILGPLSDFFAELNNAPDKDDIELVTDGLSWDMFTEQWAQTCPLERKGSGKEYVIDDETRDEDERRKRRQHRQEQQQRMATTAKLEEESVPIEDYNLRSKL